jgi:hypothetical protein
MKKNRWIFFAIFAFFHLSAFIFTVVLDNNTNLLFKMVGWVPSFKWITLIGLILLVVDIVWAVSIQKEYDREKAAHDHEMNTLKAKLFDMQDSSRNLPPQQPSQRLPKP